MSHPVVPTDPSNAFAHHTMKIRVPAVIRETIHLNPDYPPRVLQALEDYALSFEQDALIPLLADIGAPDYPEWFIAAQAHRGHTWLNTDWFFAEVYFYRHLMHLVQWWETGRDPFAPKKAEELASTALWTLLEQVLTLEPMEPEPLLETLIHASVWGNRIDLSYAAVMQEHGHQGSHSDLIVDEAPAAITHFLRTRGPVHFINDNTGTELAMDLALADTLLQLGAEQVVFHLKMQPQFVSDALPADVWHMVHHLDERGTHFAALAGRLRTAFADGRWRLSPDFFWNGPRPLWALPPHLHNALSQATLVIQKGDLNYRRMVGDQLWPPETRLTEITAAFPAPLLVLRTMKSDLIVGLQPGQAALLDAEDPLWRVNGKRGVIHFSTK
jgi:hypothetical protein